MIEFYIENIRKFILDMELYKSINDLRQFAATAYICGNFLGQLSAGHNTDVLPNGEYVIDIITEFEDKLKHLVYED